MRSRTNVQPMHFSPHSYGTLGVPWERCPAWGQLSPCHPPRNIGLPPPHRTWPSPRYPVLDVVEKTLGHERVLVQVDQVGRLGDTKKESPRYTLSTQPLRDAPKGGGNPAAPQAAPDTGSPALHSSRACPGGCLSGGPQSTEQPRPASTPLLAFLLEGLGPGHPSPFKICVVNGPNRELSTSRGGSLRQLGVSRGGTLLACTTCPRVLAAPESPAPLRTA